MCAIEGSWRRAAFGHRLACRTSVRIADRTSGAKHSTDRLTFIGRPAILNHMVDNAVAMDGVFHALSSQARRDMLGRLAHGELTVTELSAGLAMSLAAASKHVQVLERAGLVARRVEGRRHVCRLDPAPLAPAYAWLRFYERFWSGRLDALEAMVAADLAAEDTEKDQQEGL